MRKEWKRRRISRCVNTVNKKRNSDTEEEQGEVKVVELLVKGDEEDD